MDSQNENTEVVTPKDEQQENDVQDTENTEEKTAE